MKSKFKIGPGVWITAAFIGPGTITIATLAGAEFGTTLLWALLISIVSTIFIQNTVAKITWKTKKGLVEIIKDSVFIKGIKIGLLLLVIIAIFIGNSAYEAGNLSGAILGVELFFNALYGEANKELTTIIIPVFIGIFVGILLLWGNTKYIKNFLIASVLLMSISFLMTAIITKPSLKEIALGFIPTMNAENRWLIIALVGTTIVPYNLFLHAALIKKQKFEKESSLSDLRKDTLFAVLIGGIISMSIIISASAVKNFEVKSVVDLTYTLKPLYGNFAVWVIAIGLFSAGISSAITAPIAASYVMGECFGWRKDQKWNYKLVSLFVLIVGIFCTLLNIKPIQIIKLAQVTNGLLLPAIGIFLYWIVTNKKIMGDYVLSKYKRIIMIVFILFFIFLNIKTINVLGIFNI